ncbi:MAG: hypothetical protein QOE60_2639 [Thermoleophilaceae bacterium]|nr:hypothetical protein [Thermoleophilaceae bacterium]
MKRFRRAASVLVALGVLALAGDASALLGSADPDVTASAATSVTTSSAVLHGAVDPNGHGTKYFFEYGPTIAYGAKTSEGNAGSGHSAKSVSATISGLQSASTYHFRLVATSSRGTDRSGDLTFTTAAPPPPPDPGTDPGTDPGPDPDPDPGTDDPTDDPGSDDPTDDPGSSEDPGDDGSHLVIPGEQSDEPDEPLLGKSVVVAPGEGELLVRRPGRKAFVPLTYGSELPLGTEVDASDGSIALTSALPGGKVQTATFGGGRFVIRQAHGGYVDLFLRGPACPPAKHRAAKGSGALASAARNPSRRLWGQDKGGRYRTHGKNSHATVRGTRWVVMDTCAGTLTRVSRGAVVVRDEVRKKSILVKAGEHYLARPPH